MSSDTFTTDISTAPEPQREDDQALRLAISGTYSTGKSTTTEALSCATGIPRSHALTAREILMEVAPGKQLHQLSAIELTALGLRRLEERIHNEAQPGSFFSDGSVIHEWVYGEARMRIGVNPNANPVMKLIKEVAGLPVKSFYRQYMSAYGQITKARAVRIYDAYIHLPVEFEMKADGHRPVSEEFRRLSDQLLIEALDEMGIPYHVIGGPIEERLAQIIEIFSLPVVRPLDEAVSIAQTRVRESLEIIEADARYLDAQRKKPLKQRIANAVKF